MKGYCQQKHSGQITEIYPHTQTFLTKISWKQWLTKVANKELISDHIFGER